MTLTVQTGADSSQVRQWNGGDAGFTIAGYPMTGLGFTYPKALTAGDLLIVIIACRGLEGPSVITFDEKRRELWDRIVNHTGEVSPGEYMEAETADPMWSVIAHETVDPDAWMGVDITHSGQQTPAEIPMGYGSFYVLARPVPTTAERDRLRESPMRVGFDATALPGFSFSEGDGYPCPPNAHAYMFRVTGADVNRPVDSYTAAIGDLSVDGFLSIPSMKPDYRRDDTIIYIGDYTVGQSETIPRPAFAGAFPVASQETVPSAETDDDVYGSFLSLRPLASASATGTTQLSFAHQPKTAGGMAVMLRSENRPPSVTLPDSWTVDVGRQASITADAIDPDGTPMRYVWTQMDGPVQLEFGSIFSRTVTFTPTVPGVYRLQFAASDVDGGTTIATTMVTVPTGATPPSTVISGDGWVKGDGSPIENADLTVLGDADYATLLRTVGVPTGVPLVLGLPPLWGNSAITINVAGARSNASPSVARTIQLLQGSTLIAERVTYPDVRMSVFSFTTTRRETESITDRAALRLSIKDTVQA